MDNNSHTHTFFNRAFFYFIIKACVSGFIIWWLLRSIDAAFLIHNIQKCHWLTLAGSLASFWTCYALGGYRWRCIAMKREGLKFSIADSVCTTFIANFFNQGLPGSIGGDVYRSFALTKAGATKTWSIQSLLVDRLFGVFFMGILGLWGACDLWFFKGTNVLNMPQTEGISGVSSPYSTQVLFIVMFLVQLSIVGVCAFLTISDRWIKHWGNGSFIGARPTLQRIILFFTDLPGLLRAFFSKEQILFWVSGALISCVLYLPIYLFALDLGYGLTMAHVLYVMPTVFLVSVLPISFAGWGVREAAFALFFTGFGLTADQAITLSILYGMIGLLSCLPGLIAYVVPVKSRCR